MDSSRGGPLSTLILMLPLIVVPALVVLRPTEQDSGFSSDDLAAADHDDDHFLSDADDFDSVFGEEIQIHEENDHKSQHDHDHSATHDLLDGPLSDPESGDPESSVSIDDNSNPPRSSRQASRDSSPQPQRRTDTDRTPDLSRLGVTKSMWFSPGDAGVTGFAAFVPAKSGRIRYRFAAMGASKEQVVQDVVRQIKNWQSSQTDSRDRRVHCCSRFAWNNSPNWPPGIFASGLRLQTTNEPDWRCSAGQCIDGTIPSTHPP